MHGFKIADATWHMHVERMWNAIYNYILYREGLHVYAAAGGTRAHMGMHVPTADVT
jgi:hypothetical protein